MEEAGIKPCDEGAEVRESNRISPPLFLGEGLGVGAL